MNRTKRNAQKEEDVREAYHKALLHFGENAVYVPKASLIKKAMEFTAPRFYISYEEARRVVSKLSRGIDIGRKGSNKARMYADIYRRYAACGAAGFPALIRILNSEAPGFYIGKRQFIRIINKKL